MSLRTALHSLITSGPIHLARQRLIRQRDNESLLHPVYGWHQFESGVSLRKVWRYYAIGRNWRPFIYGLLGVLIFPLVFASYLIFEQTPLGFVLLFVGILVLWNLLKRPILAVRQFWRTTGISHRPPEGTINPVSPSTPTTILGDHVAVNGPVIGYDSSSHPHRIHARLPGYITERAPLAEIVKVEDGRTALILYYDMILGRGQYNVEPGDVIRRLAEAELHELSHWACTTEDHPEYGHSERWRGILHEEFDNLGVGSQALDEPGKEPIDNPPE